MSVLLSNSQNPLQSRAAKNELVMGNDAKPRGVIHFGEFGLEHRRRGVVPPGDKAQAPGPTPADIANPHRAAGLDCSWTSRFPELRPLRVPISTLEFGGREDLNL